MIDFKQKDKQQHFLVGLTLALVAGAIHPILGVLAAFGVGIETELCERFHRDKHTPDYQDALATWMGGMVGITIVYIAWKLMELF